jgi:hypothetical protein
MLGAVLMALDAQLSCGLPLAARASACTGTACRDAEVKEEGFLEYINQLLMTGEVAGLLPEEELDGLLNDVRPAFKRENVGARLYLAPTPRCSSISCLPKTDKSQHGCCASSRLLLSDNRWRCTWGRVCCCLNAATNLTLRSLTTDQAGACHAACLPMHARA